MNSAERVMACIQGTSKDRPALFLLLSLYGAKLTGCKLDQYYSDASEYLKGQERVIEKFQPDILTSPFSVAKEILAFGGTVRYYDDQPPNIIRAPITPNENLNQIRWPDIDTNSHLIYFRESLRKLSESYGKEIPIVAPWIGPFELGTCLFGLERFMEMLLYDPTATEVFLEKSSEFTVNWGNALLKEGANFLVHTATMCNTAIVTEAMASKTIAPILAKTYSKIQGGILFHHGGGRIQPLLNIYKNLPNLSGFAIDHEDDLLASRKILGENTLLMGNIDGPTLVYKTPEEIERMGNSMLEKMSAYQHYILATTSADIAYETEPEQIKALIRSVKNF